MLVRTGLFLKKIRNALSRSQWAVKLLRLSQLEQPTAQPGLIMIQIDGLSMNQFNRALHKKRLPFMERLMNRERYALHAFYSGLPSNTPAVQGELFYGVKGFVPAFNFVDQKQGRVVKMMDPDYVEEMEKVLRGKGEGLLSGGSSYSNIYAGGSSEAHFCWGHLGFGGVLHAINPLIFPFLVILYLDIFVRMFFLLIVEFCVALIECIRGAYSGRQFFYELHFVWMRVLVCVFLRELIVAGAAIDMMRGLPIIHMNFLGYDEQAHCRGPSTSYAHWSLQGIDDAIGRIYGMTRHTPLRHYDIWIYSDHGQETTAPYEILHGMTINEAVEKVFSDAYEPAKIKTALRRTEHTHAGLLKPRRRSVVEGQSVDFKGRTSLVTAMGPLGEVYVNRPLSQEEIDFYGKKLAKDARIPLVMARGGHGKVIAWMDKGTFVLPEQIEEVAGKDHPFLEELKEDLIRICHHGDAGEYVIAGWARGVKPISLSMEFGAHAGMGGEETKGFALLPIDAPLPSTAKDYIRPMDLRHAVQEFRSPSSVRTYRRGGPRQSKEMCIMSYNVQGCLGRDGQISMDKIARIIARHKPDIVCLQELDCGRPRSDRAQQAEVIARKLEMEYHFHSAFRWKDEQYGNAILSRWPVSLIKMDTLPQRNNLKHNEPRGAMWVTACIDGINVQVINTHLSLWPRERLEQVEHIMGPQWLGHPDCKGPVVLCGDFNALPGSHVHRRVSKSLKECRVPGKKRRKGTWFGEFPLWQLDHIFVSSEFTVNDVMVGQTSLEKSASDHLPLIAHVRVGNVRAIDRMLSSPNGHKDLWERNVMNESI